YLAKSGAANKLLRNDGGGVFTDVTNDALGDIYNGVGVAWGGYDLDGDLDLYLANYGAGPLASNKLFRNDTANGNHWLHVKRVGTISNRFGVGARVQVVAGGTTQIREVSGGAGNQSSSAMMAQFGLGAATSLTALAVHWPTGATQIVNPLPRLDGTVTVTEVSTTDAQPSPAPRLTLELARPNPVRGELRAWFTLPGSEPATMELIDVAGRRVA